MELRYMSVDDYQELITLWEGFEGTTLTGADGPSGFAGFLRMNGGYCFVAEEGGRVVGSVMAGSDSRRGYIYHLAVKESMQGTGIGRKLMTLSENALREAGIEKAHLFIYTDNPALEFYRRIGWHDRHDITVMSKVLRGDEYTGTRRDG